MIEGLKPYPEYRDSAARWLRSVPKHWGCLRGKNLFRQSGLAVRAGDGVVTCFRDGQVTLRTNRRTAGFTNAILEGGYQGVRKGQLVIHAMDAFAGAIGVSDSDGKCTPEYAVCDPVGDASPYYYARLLREAARLDYIRIECSAVRERAPRFRYASFGNMSFPVPPPDEQKAIVKFIEHADGRIRRYIRAKQKLIKLLEEQKQSIVHRAVTRGLDPNVRLRPSGIEWLGDVPEHWKIVRCRYLFREIDVRSVDGSEQHLSVSQRLGVVPANMVQRSLTSASYKDGKLCRVGDLVLNRLKAHLGVFYMSRFAGVVSPDYTILHPLTGGAAFFEHVLRGPAIRSELRRRTKGIVEGFWRLYTDDFYDLKMPVPPLSDRIAVGEAIESITADISAAERKIERELKLVEEFRARVIADVVSGKVDVRHSAASLPDEIIGQASTRSDDDDLEEEADPTDEEAAE